MVRGLLVTDPGASSPRPTKDVDLVVEVNTRIEYYGFCDVLRARGFGCGSFGTAVISMG